MQSDRCCMVFSGMLSLLSLALVIGVTWPDQARGWVSPAAQITGKIELVDGEKWAHVNDETEFCRVRVYDVTDVDRYLDMWGNQKEDDNGFYDNARFDGGTKGFCLPEVHASETRWYATGTGQSMVTATLIDKYPGTSTDDPDRTLTLGQDPANGHFCAGFRVKTMLAISGEFSESATMEEGGTAIDITKAGDFCDWVWAGGSGIPGTAQSVKYVGLQLDFATIPSDAAPRRRIQAKCEWKPSAVWGWEVKDSDDPDGPGGTHGVSVGVSFFGAASYTYTWPALNDAHEGEVQAVWSYATTDVGAQYVPTAAVFIDESKRYSQSQLPHSSAGTQTQTVMARGTGTGYVTKMKGGVSQSVYTINMEMKAIGNNPNDAAKGQLKFGECNFKVTEVKYEPQ